MSSMIDQIRRSIDRVADRGSDTSSASTAAVVFAASIYVTSRYVPEYLRLLDARPVVIGLFGSVVMLLAVSYPYLRTHVRDATGSVAGSRVAGGVAALGLALWLVAPQLGRIGPVPPWLYVVLGAVLLGSWRPIGLDVVDATGNGWLYDRVSDSALGTRAVRLAGMLAVVALVTGVLAAVPGFVVGFQVVLALATAVGVTTAVVRYHADVDPGDVSMRRLHGGSTVLSDVRSLPDGVRPLLIGDTLVQFALGMISVFIVVTVTSVLEFDAHVLGHPIGPGAFFGVLILVEVGVGLAAAVPLNDHLSRNGRRGTVFVSFLVSALFPLLLVGTTTTPLSLVVLFAVFGLRFAGRPARKALIATETGRNGDERATESYRLLRDVLTIPSALLGGVIYAISPVFAFTLATVVGIIGVREFMEFLIRPYDD